ncbi:hypothetical protein GCM10009730_59770 [Streptomyces albidochromogenes]|uniref:hypothetical protein n=1 Tax=Streptomyces albidochromogenes TaxID=329524 RepID=UPI00110F8E2B|nr:hypothetical protein [Streptomyces albidochromogenes]
MTSDRALVVPGLLPLTEAELTSILRVPDEHLRRAARICRFDPAEVDPAEGSAGLLSTVHEALLAVGLIRRLAHEPAAWRAYGGLSAGCLTALLFAGAITEETCFHLIREINSRQIEANTARRSGTFLTVLPSSQGDAYRLVDALRACDPQPWLSVDLGAGVIAISITSTDTKAVQRVLTRLGVAVLDVLERAEHCPYAAPGRTVLQDTLADVEFLPATAAVICPRTGKRVDDTPQAYRDMLTQQWFDTASLPLLIDGLCAVDQVTAVDLVGPATSFLVPRVRDLLTGRAGHRHLAAPLPVVD